MHRYTDSFVALFSAFIALALVLMLVACGTNTKQPAVGPAPSRVTPAPATTDSAPAATEGVAPEQKARQRVDVTFSSQALGVEKSLSLLLPADYQSSGKRYPVVYMLHGGGGNQGNWIDLGIGHAADEVGIDAIFAFPDGDDSFYVNWKTVPDYKKCLAGRRAFGAEPDMSTYCVRSARYSDYLLNDIVGYVDAHYRTIADRSGRAIGGMSMGGYGALVNGFRHPEMFAAVASHAGVASLRYVGPHPFVAGKVQQFDDPELAMKNSPFAPIVTPIFGLKLADWKANNPADLVAQLKDGDIAIYLDAGTNDSFAFHDGAAHLSEVLTRAKIKHDFHLIDGGGHDANFWRSRIDDSLRFFAKHLAPAH